MNRRQKRALGATGRHPQGVLNSADEGELRFAVRGDELDGLVHIDFGTPVKWLALPPEQAIELALSLMSHAGAKRVEVHL